MLLSVAFRQKLMISCSTELWLFQSLFQLFWYYSSAFLALRIKLNCWHFSLVLRQLPRGEMLSPVSQKAMEHEGCAAAAGFVWTAQNSPWELMNSLQRCRYWRRWGKFVLWELEVRHTEQTWQTYRTGCSAQVTWSKMSTDLQFILQNITAQVKVRQGCGGWHESKSLGCPFVLTIRAAPPVLELCLPL